MKNLDPIVEVLRAARLAQGLSVKELAARSRVGASTIYDWEVGTRDPSLYLLRRVAEALRVALYTERLLSVRELRPHGTAAAMARHRYRKEPACAACKAWDAERCATARRARRQSDAAA